ncbi:MAG: TonB-dependent receptor, partial [Bryobacteraceae bacterium]
MVQLSRTAFVSAIILVALLGPAAIAQTNKGTISGRAVDTAGGVLQGAQITIQPGGNSTVSNGQGDFTINDLAPGNYAVTIEYVGFSPLTTKVTVAAGQVARVDAPLKVASRNEEVVVYGERPHGEAEAINRERTADNILDVLPAEVITSLPNANVADALGRMPGVTLERDEGEGKYVQIRGTEPRLNNVTIDGINVPSPEGNVLQIKLDVIPSDIVESIEINKTLQANMDGDGIGGSVNLVTKTAGDSPSVSVSGLGGYTPILGGRSAEQVAGTVGDRFGKEKRFGALFGVTWDYNGRGIDDIEPTPDAVQTGSTITPSYDSIDVREYRYHRYRYGFAGSLDYKLAEGSSVYLRYLYSDFEDFGDKWTYTLNNGDVPKYKTSSRTPDYAIGNMVVGGNHSFGLTSIVWEAAVSRARELDAAGNPGVTFKATGALKGLTSCVYDPADTTDPYLPQFSPSCTAPGSPIYDPDNYKMSELDTSYGLTAQLNLQAAASIGRSYRLDGHFGTFLFGGKVRNEHKYQDAYQGVYDPTTTLLMNQFLSSFTNNNYYMNNYRLGPVTNYNTLTSFFYSNPNDFSLDVGSTHLGSDPNNFDLTERISAAYAMNTLDFGRFRLVTGVRFEGTQLGTLGNYVTNDANGNWVSTTPVRSTASYVDILPSASLRYKITDDSDIRLVYGRGISRPNPYDLIPYFQEDDQGQTLTIGNPKLTPEHANNYDLLYEHYLRPWGIIQGGFFYKALTDPMYEVATSVTNGPFAGFEQYQLVNGSSAWLYGFEVAYQQHFGFLPGAMGGLGFSGNYSYTVSQANDVPGRSDDPPLQRQAPNTWNLSPTYDRGRISLRVGLSYNGASIYAYQYQDGAQFGLKGPFGDTYFYPHLQVDAQASIRVARDLNAVIYGLNLNNEVFGFYNGSPEYVLQREFYGPT